MKAKKDIVLSVLLILVIIHAYGQGSEKSGQNNEANRYMHQYDVDRLIDAFDSPERAKWQKPTEVIQLFGDLKGKKIMDLGAGSGYFTLRLANHGASVVAADVNEEFQNSIREKLEQEEFEHLAGSVELRKIPYDNPDLKDNEVDGILIVNTYHHISDRVEYMKRALPGIKDGGKLIIVDFKIDSNFGPPRSHKLDVQTSVSELLQVGFSTILIDLDMLERQYVIICRK